MILCAVSWSLVLGLIVPALVEGVSTARYLLDINGGEGVGRMCTGTAGLMKILRYGVPSALLGLVGLGYDAYRNGSGLWPFCIGAVLTAAFTTLIVAVAAFMSV